MRSVHSEQLMWFDAREPRNMSSGVGTDLGKPFSRRKKQTNKNQYPKGPNTSWQGTWTPKKVPKHLLRRFLEQFWTLGVYCISAVISPLWSQHPCPNESFPFAREPPHGSPLLRLQEQLFAFAISLGIEENEKGCQIAWSSNLLELLNITLDSHTGTFEKERLGFYKIGFDGRCKEHPKRFESRGTPFIPWKQKYLKGKVIRVVLLFEYVNEMWLPQVISFMDCQLKTCFLLEQTRSLAHRCDLCIRLAYGISWKQRQPANL